MCHHSGRKTYTASITDLGMYNRDSTFKVIKKNQFVLDHIVTDSQTQLLSMYQITTQVQNLDTARLWSQTSITAL